MRRTKTTSAPMPPPEVAAQLAHFFQRNGYVRRQSAERLSRDGYLGYKKGDEVRLTAKGPEELAVIRDLLVRAGFEPGRPFGKGRQMRQPVYGRAAVERFLDLISMSVTLGGRAAYQVARSSRCAASAAVRTPGSSSACSNSAI